MDIIHSFEIVVLATHFSSGSPNSRLIIIPMRHL
jgi:hypothetical protein